MKIKLGEIFNLRSRNIIYVVLQIFVLIIPVVIFILAVVPSKTAGKDALPVSDSFGSGDVQLVTLSDGTKCAVLIGMYKGAISCNWK